MCYSSSVLWVGAANKKYGKSKKGKQRTENWVPHRPFFCVYVLSFIVPSRRSLAGPCGRCAGGPLMHSAHATVPGAEGEFAIISRERIPAFRTLRKKLGSRPALSTTASGCAQLGRRATTHAVGWPRGGGGAHRSGGNHTHPRIAHRPPHRRKGGTATPCPVQRIVAAVSIAEDGERRRGARRLPSRPLLRSFKNIFLKEPAGEHLDGAR